ncbi:MAG: hypothetical protein EHM33_01485 [Chloroflexi bacterium]|nr:MAG: hypothetical protein EHM33_01485 [Chloroflexota bacterium]
MSYFNCPGYFYRGHIAYLDLSGLLNVHAEVVHEGGICRPGQTIEKGWPLMLPGSEAFTPCGLQSLQEPA